jgi:hypothetical protein
MRRALVHGVFLVALCGCSSSSSGGGADGGSSADGASACPGKPESNHAGSCLFYGLAPAGGGDAGDDGGGAPLVYCTDYTGSGLTPAGSVTACKTSLGVMGASCPTTGVLGSCILQCGTPFETVSHYYSGAGPAKQQCDSLPVNYWLQ